MSKRSTACFFKVSSSDGFLFYRDPLGTVVGGLVGVPTGLMFSGKFVPCVGFSGVAVGLSGRGSGFGGRVVAQVRMASLLESIMGIWCHVHTILRVVMGTW